MSAAHIATAETTTAEMRAALPDLPRDAAGPVFKAPWEAQAFAMALALHERCAIGDREDGDADAEHEENDGEQHFAGCTSKRQERDADGRR